MRPESIPNFRAEKYLSEFWYVQMLDISMLCSAMPLQSSSCFTAAFRSRCDFVQFSRSTKISEIGNPASVNRGFSSSPTS